MIKVSHSTLIFLSGLVWFAVGCFLLPLGLNLIVAALLSENADKPHPILNFFASYAGIDSAALILISLSMLIGFIKGRTVFSKTVNKSVQRIIELPNPTPLTKLYPSSYLILLAIMVLLGILLRFVPQDIRGGVDVAVGCALINGSVLYFRQAWGQIKKTKQI